jgi:long-chain acyl-CoA synthetase
MNSIIRALERNAALHPDREAIRGSDLTLSWAQLQEETDVLAPVVSRSGALGVHVANSPSWIVADLAAMATGVTNVPLPGFFSDSQLRHAIRDAQIGAVITDEPWRIACLAHVQAETEVSIAGKCLALLSLPPTQRREEAPRPAKITYTSGTTGAPRGVRLRISAIERVCTSLAQVTEAGRDDRALVVLPLSILLENIGSVLAPILTGAKVIVPDPSELGITGSSSVDPDRFANALIRYRPTTLILPPQLLKVLVGIARQGRLRNDFRFIAVGSAPVGEALLAAAREVGLPVFQGYGLTEACSVVAVNSPTDNRCGSVGRPLAHSRVRVDAGGRIFVSGITCDGYLGGQPLAEGEEVDTGDVGYMDEEGYLYVRGRSQNRIVTGYGRNVSPEWIEAELVASDCIARATVFSEPEDILAAVLVPAKGVPATELARVVSETNQRLPDYARIGRFVIDRPSFGHDVKDARHAAEVQGTVSGEVGGRVG